MQRYRFHGLGLEVRPAELETRAQLPRLWADLSWRPSRDADDGEPVRRLSLKLHDEPLSLPPTLRHAFTTSSFSGFDDDDGFFLSDRESVFHLRSAHLEGNAYLAPSFFAKSLTQQYAFWSFGVAKLLRSVGLYSLHAAGLVRTTSEDAILVIGASGSGKTTLTLDAIRRGWRYVSDDAVLLGGAEDAGGVAALGLRKHLYIDSDASARHDGFQFGADIADDSGGNRRRVLLAEHESQRMGRCIPQLLLFPTIANRERSVMRPLSQASAFTALLDASSEQLWDRQTMPQHLAILKALVAQAPAFELQAGRDVYRDSSLVFRWLRERTPDRRLWCDS
jgi:hypothetical protein